MSQEKFLTREQRYAGEVFARVATFAQKANVKKKEPDAYGSLAHKLPILIRSAGLAQALAFVKARNKKDSPQRRLLEDLEQVLHESGVLAKGAKLSERSREAEFEEYMRLTEGALQALLWFKRFAQSELGVAAASNDTEEHHA